MKLFQSIRAVFPILVGSILVGSILVGGGCRQAREVVFSGKTMGTTYLVKIVTGTFQRTAFLEAAIAEELRQINQSMSTYLADSELNRFNALTIAEAPFVVSESLWEVLQTARLLHTATNGAWDGTLDPLIKLWGFGSTRAAPEIPADDAIQELLAFTGFEHIRFGDQDRWIAKKHIPLTLDLASIAKGYGVDQIAARLRRHGFDRFLIEIGGDLYASGLNREGAPWRVGINVPDPQAPVDAVYKVMEIQDFGMATSGDYRIFAENQGRRYSHILDPRTGYPVDNAVVSATVLAPTCALADGLATALMVMQPHEGIALIDTLPEVEAMLILQQTEGRFGEVYSRGLAVAP